MHSRFLKQVFSFFLVAIFLVITTCANQFVHAGSLTGTTITLSNTTANQTNVTHTITTTLATTNSVQQVNIHYETTAGSNTPPPHLDLSGATLNSITGLGTGWHIDFGSISTGYLKLTNTTPQSATSGTTVTIVLGGITNSAINDCESGDNGLVDTCSVTVTTYADAGVSSIDTGGSTYTVQEDPSLSFQVSGVTSGSTHNGVTATVTSTATSLPFGIIDPGGVSYATQELDISTNAPAGYTVTAVLPAKISGTYNNAEIDEFAGLNATWTTPQSWSTPDGVTANDNTGWFGANTSDTRVSGWSSASGKFGPFGTIARTVAYSSGPDSGSTIYVSYALGVNGAQPADNYTGTIIYNIQANY